MTSKLKVIWNSCVASGCILILLLTSGCSCFRKMHQFHQTAISHFPRRSALDPPTVVPYYANPMFFGYHGACWHDWPEGWIECPCYDISGIPTETEAEVLPPIPLSDIVHPAIDAENAPPTEAVESAWLGFFMSS